MKKILLMSLFLSIFFRPIIAAGSERETVYDRVMRTGTLRCGYEPWPPYFSVDPNTKALTGVSKDLSDTAAKILGLKIDYVEVALGQQVQDMNNGKIDATCGDAPWVLTTLKYADYTKPYFYIPVFAYGRANEKRFAKPEDMNNPNVTFTMIDGDVSTDLAITNFPRAKLNSLGNLSDPSQMLLNVMTRKADVVIIDPVAVSVFAKNNPGKIKILFSHPLAVYGGGFSVKKGETDLLNTLNGAVDAMINTGQAEHVLKKHDPAATLFMQVATPWASRP
jgi:polar amino acid transport system substrate-binding protein